MRLAQKFYRYYQIAGLSRTTRLVMQDSLTYLSVEKLKRIERAANETRAISGDVLEFGVALGGSGIILARHAIPLKRFIGFDVFAMIPPPTSDKDDIKSKERYKVIAAGDSDGIDGKGYYGYREDLFSDVRMSFAKYGVPLSEHVALHKGLFEDTWPDAGVKNISLAHIDCDWYDPVKFCLQSCADRLANGGILIIDDYNDYGGCRAAVDEFLMERDDFTMEPGPNPFLKKKCFPGQEFCNNAHGL